MMVNPRDIIYRFCDYDDDVFNYPGFPVAPRISPGAQRPLYQPKLQQMNIEVIRAIAHLGMDVHLLVPCIQLPRRYAEGHEIIDRKLGGAPNLGSIGAMPEVPENPFGSADCCDAGFF